MDSRAHDHRITTGTNTWRAGCAETRTSGSAGGLRKRASTKDWYRAAGRPNRLRHERGFVVSSIHHMSNMWTAPNGKEYLVLPDGNLLPITELDDWVTSELIHNDWTDQDCEESSAGVGLLTASGP
jgi:hypothetical protein